MKLKEFNAENTVSRTGSPTLSFNTKSGVFNLNKLACELLNLASGDSVVFHQDETEAEDWYIEKAERNIGFALRGKDVKNGLSFNNTTLARTLADSAQYSAESGKILMAANYTHYEDRKLYGLFTSSLKPRE